MARLAKYQKLPGDRKRYTIDYTDWLDTTELILSVNTFMNVYTGNPLVVDGVVVDNDQKSVVMFISGGDEGSTYDVGVEITTDTGQIKDDILTWVVRPSPIDFP